MKEDVLYEQSAYIVGRERSERTGSGTIIQKARSRGLWNSMIAKVKRYGDYRDAL